MSKANAFFWEPIQNLEIKTGATKRLTSLSISLLFATQNSHKMLNLVNSFLITFYYPLVWHDMRGPRFFFWVKSVEERLPQSKLDFPHA